MQPNSNLPCGFCQDRFGGHYETYDMQRSGCSVVPSKRKNGAVCKCPGFMLLWRVAVRAIEQASLPEPQDVESR